MDVDVVAPVRIEYEGKRPLDEGQLDRPPLPTFTSPLSSPFKRLKGMSDGEDEPVAENERAQAAAHPLTSPLTPTATPPTRRSAILAVRGTKVGFNETNLFLEQQASTAARAPAPSIRIFARRSRMLRAVLARFHAEVSTEAPRMPDAYLPLVANLVQDRCANDTRAAVLSLITAAQICPARHRGWRDCSAAIPSRDPSRWQPRPHQCVFRGRHRL